MNITVNAKDYTTGRRPNFATLEEAQSFVARAPNVRKALDTVDRCWALGYVVRPANDGRLDFAADNADKVIVVGFDPNDKGPELPYRWLDVEAEYAPGTKNLVGLRGTGFIGQDVAHKLPYDYLTMKRSAAGFDYRVEGESGRQEFTYNPDTGTLTWEEPTAREP